MNTIPKTFLITLLALLAGRPALFAESSASIDELRRQIAALDRKIAALEQRTTPSLGKSILSENLGHEQIKAGNSGLVIQSADGKTKFQFGGLIQLDYNSYLQGPAGDDTFTFRRLRPRLRGTINEVIDFDFQPEFAWSNTSNTVRILDAYGDVKFDDALRFRFGQFKSPLGLERNAGASQLLFLERGIATNLVPTRDIGVQIHGKFLDGAAEYKLALFNGSVDLYDGRGNADNNEGLDVAGGIFFHPFKNTGPKGLKGLGLGLAASWGDRSGSVVSSSGSDGRRIRYTSATGDGFFGINPNGTEFDGENIRLNPQLYYYAGPFGFLAEYVYNSQSYLRGGVSTKVENHAVSGQVSWVLTGEKASYKGVTPKKSFALDEEGGWGAWEVAGRVGFFQSDSSAFTGPATSRLATADSAEAAFEFTLGINWYLTENVKAQANYSHVTYDSPAGTLEPREDSSAVQARLQFSF